MQKACDHFLRASNGILTDVFLVDALLDSNVTSGNNALIHYYLKVIKLFEEHNASDCIIEIAETAIAAADADDPNLPTLYSIMFAEHLSLGYHMEAYRCLNANPDAARRVDCLRQLVSTLFEKKLLIDLISFPYVDMYDDLERIVEGRARSVDLMENNYYNFLYSFHVNKRNMRKGKVSYPFLQISICLSMFLLHFYSGIGDVRTSNAFKSRTSFRANYSEASSMFTGMH